MRNPNRISAWELLILLICSALLCLEADDSAPISTPHAQHEAKAVRP